ncbi:hypothetical protein DXG03_003542 [Asterophora parasitica]|uniref:TEA domain-containing protein n=1 Tax=Asterophora parasitica TaxID=117018 RepID=A0A9P7G206_9AGAR|nr:hypothetical protein DXG03_003542 [Asterophora parasitica]
MSAPPQKIFLSTSFIGDLGYEAPTNQVAGMAHTLVTGRKTWKTSKGKNEAVWPAHIEAALFDALEKYRPTSSGDPRLLRRFPKRNRFISDHIYKVTGKARTPKQVGSRLQQLRDTCQEPKGIYLFVAYAFEIGANVVQVLALLSRREFPTEFPPEIQTQSLVLRRSESPTPSLSSASTTPASSPFTADFPEMFLRNCNLMSPVASAVILPSPPTVVIDVVSQPSHSILPSEPAYLVEFNLPADGPYPSLTPEQANVRLAHSGPLSNAVPSVKILSADTLPDAVRSVFCVYLDGLFHHKETADLEVLPTVDANGNVQYRTKLMPQYWSTLSQGPDLSRYTITQDVMKATCIEEDQTIQEAFLFCVTYEFKATTTPVVKPPTFNPVEYAFHSADPHMGPNVPVYAPRPLLLQDTANTLLSVPGQAEQLWYDSCGGVIAAPVMQEPAYDFLGVGDTDLSNAVDANHNWVAPHSLYINLQYNWP